ncbi:MAG: ATP-dependent DNA helicase [Thermodesulfobacteriota bacterium]
MDLLTDIEEIFAPDGLLARRLSSYEQRPGQLQMARAVATILHDDNPWGEADLMGKRLAVEAETGIGKTLAYLIPAALSGQKIVISTATINLQQQILDKEIPFVKAHIQPQLAAVCVKGRQNYLCLHRFQQFLASPQKALFKNSRLDDLKEWAAATLTGDRSELDWLPDNSPLWRELSATTNQCLGGSCPDFATCHITSLRRSAAAADLIIVNHHLFFSDLSLRRHGFGEVLPRYESVIFDEAHHLENVATTYFGTSLSHYQLMDLAQDMAKEAAVSLAGSEVDKVGGMAISLEQQALRLATLFPAEQGRFDLAAFIKEQGDVWSRETDLLANLLDGLGQSMEALAKKSEGWNSLGRRLLEAQSALEQFTGASQPSHVYWYERRARTVALTASPIDIAAEMQEHLYPQVKSTTFTSATLTTGSTFSYFFSRLGLGEETETVRLPSPFDYANRTRLFIPPKNFPPPTAPGFLPAVQEMVLEILLASKGRGLVLFTSFRALDYMYQFLGDELPYPVLKQGEAPKGALLEKFRQETHSVLLAVASFWEGVDVPGESLSCVIIDKLPFEVPSDPVIKARVAKIEEEGGRPFFQFQVPRAILTLRQGLGRLLRSMDDQGLLAILDVRLRTKGYGKTFLKSLPASPIIDNLEQVENFFDDFS